MGMSWKDGDAHLDKKLVFVCINVKERVAVGERGMKRLKVILINNVLYFQISGNQIWLTVLERSSCGQRLFIKRNVNYNKFENL